MNRRFGVLFTLLTGGLVLRLSTTGEYLSYVRPGMRPWLIASAGVLLLVALIGIVDEVRRALWRPEYSWFSDDDSWESGIRGEHGHAEGPQGHRSEDHEHRAPKAAWLLLLPVVAILAFPTKPLGSFAASRQGSAVKASTIQFEVATGASVAVTESIPPPVPGAIDMQILDFLDRTYYDESKSLAGVTVNIVGFVAPGERSSDTFLLTRFMIACCAADARPVQVAVTGYSGFVPSIDSWVEVTGSWQPEAQGTTARLSSDGFPLPTLVTMRVAPIAPPAYPYTTFSDF